jgi:hypothetical protein
MLPSQAKSFALQVILLFNFSKFDFKLWFILLFIFTVFLLIRQEKEKYLK